MYALLSEPEGRLLEPTFPVCPRHCEGFSYLSQSGLWEKETSLPSLVCPRPLLGTGSPKKSCSKGKRQLSDFTRGWFLSAGPERRVDQS